MPFTQSPMQGLSDIGADDLIKFLEEQNAQDAAMKVRPAIPGGLGRAPVPASVELPPVHQFPPMNPPMGGGTTVSPVARGGVLAESMGGAGSLLRGLAGIVGKLAVPLSVGYSMIGPAKNAGRAVGQAVYDAENPGARQKREADAARASRLPTLTEMGYPELESNPAKAQLPLPAPAAQPVAQVTKQPNTFSPKEVAPAKSLGYVPTEIQYDDSRDSAEPAKATPVADANYDYGDSTVQPEQEADDFMKQVLATLEPKAPVEELPNAQTEQDIKELTAPRQGVKTPEPTTLLGKIGRGASKFLASVSTPSGAYDPTRYERDQLELEQARQKFTPQEALKGDLAVAERQGRQQFNRQSQLQAQGQQDEAARAKANVMVGQRGQQLSRQAKKEDMQAEHGYRMEEIGASGAAQRQSPGAIKGQLQASMLEKYPDLFTPDQVEMATGLRPSPEALKVVQDARLKNDPMAMMVAQILQERLGKGLPQQANKKPLAVKALSGEK